MAYDLALSNAFYYSQLLNDLLRIAHHLLEICLRIPKLIDDICLVLINVSVLNKTQLLKAAFWSRVILSSMLELELVVELSDVPFVIVSNHS